MLVTVDGNMDHRMMGTMEHGKLAKQVPSPEKPMIGTFKSPTFGTFFYPQALGF